MKRTLVAIVGMGSLWLGGCGGAMSSEQAPSSMETGGETGGGDEMVVQPTLDEQRTVSSYADDMQGLATDLQSSMTLSTGPDCDGAATLRDRICDLSDRICDIATRHPGWSDVESKCEDATTRCENARSDVSSQCGD